MPKGLENSRGWLALVIGFLMVAQLGYIDYLTGDYSILIFYLIPVLLVAWFLGRCGAVFISLAAGAARFVSDYSGASGQGSPVVFWNCLQDMAFLLLVGILLALVKKLLSEDQQ